jgi:Holliday junction DNA helicase RuvA
VIASVRGLVLALRLDGAVVDVGGVGMLVHATPSSLADLRPGAETTLHTSLVVREDSLTLYGFPDVDERDVFEAVQTVSGVGPRLALAMLAVLSPEDLRRAVASDDLNALVKVPGIGRKGAQRIVLELGDRLGAPSGAPGARAAGPAGAAAARPAAPSPVVEALVGLGWSAKQAEDALAAVAADDPELAAGRDLAGVLRAALSRLGRRS